MLRSMTAYGRADVQTALGRCVVEMHSVNRRFLELRLALPRELLRFDPEVREWIGQKLSRGQVNVSATVTYANGAAARIVPNRAIAQQYAEAFRELAGPDATIPWEWILQQEGVLRTEDGVDREETYREFLREGITEALTALEAMKEREGLTLQNDILGRLQTIQASIEGIEARSGIATEGYRAKLTQRLVDFTEGALADDERVLREVVMYAERIDVTEELIRLRSHIEQARGLFKGRDQVIGRTLEFLVQEMARETTTIASKSNDTLIAQHTITIKTELERIREQVQNVE